MRPVLKLHPGCRCEAVTRIEAEVTRSRPNVLAVEYFLTGRTRDLRLPVAMAPARADGLWHHTCFEAFVRSRPGRAYYEFNFAPSLQWSAYRFDEYRSGMRELGMADAPQIEVRSYPEFCRLRATLVLHDPYNPETNLAWHLGLSAVIEETSGGVSYWALEHPPGKPDFHHADCFALEVPAASRV